MLRPMELAAEDSSLAENPALCVRCDFAVRALSGESESAYAHILGSRLLNSDGGEACVLWGEETRHASSEAVSNFAAEDGRDSPGKPPGDSLPSDTEGRRSSNTDSESSMLSTGWPTSNDGPRRSPLFQNSQGPHDKAAETSRTHRSQKRQRRRLPHHNTEVIDSNKLGPNLTLDAFRGPQKRTILHSKTIKKPETA
ncbi:type III secretion effector, putative [Babesia ovata]|uniref:Type III secretion effector, putative n=1 Tax=Babesia ovata TaxID=189622 RepID=A0A2H6K9D2_9APIC|nr:type III secretion effector, putative [Babesia ovata]GBE59593.1 type III secretion effector, putative [Babesia ovata]